jgi:enoyl-CoA hydratase/carnithine racemase
VAADSAVFGFPEAALGILPSSGGLTRVVRMLGAARAKELMLVRERFSAAEALGWGLVTEVVAEGEEMPAALELARRLASLPALAVATTKQATEAAAESSREAALLIERLAYGMLAQTPEADEAAAAFVEKRAPRRGA